MAALHKWVILRPLKDTLNSIDNAMLHTNTYTVKQRLVEGIVDIDVNIVDK